MSTQTEAERLAIALTDHVEYYGDGFSEEQGCLAAAELRRLVSFNNDLMDEVERLKKALAEQPAPVQQEHLPNDLQFAIDSMIETYKEGNLDGWEAHLVKRGLRICAHNIKENT